jgi:hypothetical protein
MSHHEDKHNQMTDDEFDTYLKRNSSVSSQYKQAAQDEVPTELDQKILRQAREALSDKKVVTHPSWWTKWNKPLALAATLLLAVTVIYRVGDRSIDNLAVPESATITTKLDAPTSSPPPSAVNKEEKVASSGLADAATDTKRLQFEPAPPPTMSTPALKRTSPIAAPAAGAPAAAPAAPAINQEMEKDKVATSGALARLSEKPAQQTVTDPVTANVDMSPDDSVAESFNRIPSVTLAKRERSIVESKKEARTADPEELLQHIRELRKQGKEKEALKAWKQFRKSFPDYPVADDDSARMK